MEESRVTLKTTAAWKQAVLAHCPWLKRFIGSRLNQADCVEDVLQETLQSALTEKQPQKVENVQAWLTGIARNKVLQYQRKQVKRRSISARLHQESDLAHPHEATPFDILVHKERNSLVLQALESLDSKES